VSFNPEASAAYMRELANRRAREREAARQRLLVVQQQKELLRQQAEQAKK
jgi:hypothetical protein